MTAGRARVLDFDDFAIPGAGCHVARAKYRPGDFIAMHGHDFAEVFWIESGRGAHRTPQSRVDLHPGFLCLIAPGDEPVAAACSAAFSELGRTNLGRLALHRFLLEVLVVAHRELDSRAQAHRLPSWLASAIDEAAHSTDILGAGVTGLASCAGRSVDHLNRTCRRYLQTTASGFENLSYFYRRFRERHGVPPSRYRARGDR